MTKFNFSDDEPLDSKNVLKNPQYLKVGKQSKLTLIIKNYLFSSINKLSTIDLPSNIDIKYVEDSKVVQSLIKVAEKLNIKKIGSINIKEDKYPEGYIYPASMSPSNATLYLSKDFNKESDKISKKINNIETNDVVKYRNCFNGNNEKALEYVFGHELGHFFILSKNVTKPELEQNKVIQRISMNIEEGFAEAFSIQLMYLKDANLDITFVKNSRFFDSKLKLEEKISSNIDPTQRAQFFNTYGFDKLIDTYNFKKIYDNLPIRNSSGNIENDINKIYTACLKISKDNNKEIICDILNNNIYKKEAITTVFENDLKTSIKDIPNIKINKLDTEQLINQIHIKINGTSFNTSQMKMLRERFLKNQHDSTYKPT